MFTSNPFAELSASIAPSVMQAYIVVMIILLLLMLQFDDVRKTFINLAVLPFSITGVTFGLLLFDSYFGFIGLDFSWPILNYGRIKNNVRIQDARFQQSVVNYQDPVLRAAAAVERHLSRFRQSRTQARHRSGHHGGRKPKAGHPQEVAAGHRALLIATQLVHEFLPADRQLFLVAHSKAAPGRRSRGWHRWPRGAGARPG